MRFILGVVLSAVVLFVWGFVFWTVLPYSPSVFQELPNPTGVVAALNQDGPLESGVYMIPGGDPANEETANRYQQGPIATLLFRKDGANPMDPMVMVKGFLHMLGSSFLLAIVLATAGRRTYMGRFLLCFWIGLFVSIWAEMSGVIWYHYPISYACIHQTYHVTSLIVLGAILSFFIQPPGDEQHD